MPQLIAPTTRLHDSWIASRDEWGRGVHQDGADLGVDDEVDTPAGFSAWVQRLLQQSDTSVPPRQGRVHATSWWIVEQDTYLGAISLRHELNDFLLNAGGHIGYGIRPTARRRGLATWALGAVLPEARSLGLSRVLVTCDDTNLGSARTIEINGGVLEDIRDTALGRTRRSWITL
jgi:predicted acetyltransferase